jgi:uncharacterized protein YciI
MFVIVLTYVKPLEEVERLLDDHNVYLDRNYQAGRFIASGRQEPRTGGVILARAASAAEIHATVAEDPFVRAGIANPEIIEFVPSRHAAGFEALR